MPAPPTRRGLAAASVALGAAAVVRRAARRRGMTGPGAARIRPAGGPPHGPAVVVANPSSGSAGRIDVGDVPVRTVGAGDSLDDVLRDAAAGAGVLGVAGGDGTVRCAARVAHDLDRVLWVVPGGTLNHFAVSLGLATAEEARAALDAGRVAAVDLAWAGDEVFVNTASVGVYGEIVARREALEHRRVPKSVAQFVATLATVWRARPLEVLVDGRRERVWLVFVGNGPYAGIGISGRPRLQTGLLDVRLLRARGRLPRLAVAARLVAGRLRGSPWLRRRVAREVRLTIPRDVPLALDGELLGHGGEVLVRSDPGALRVVVGAAAVDEGG